MLSFFDVMALEWWAGEICYRGHYGIGYGNAIALTIHSLDLS